MALSQAMNLDIDPGVAFHELAHRDGNAVANEELRWFRAADHGQAWGWIDIAMGRQDRLPSVIPGEPTALDLAAPIHRWRCNYAAALKIATLELSDETPLVKLEHLMRWMVEDFIVAGPAAMFAAMYFGPSAPRAGLLKQLNAKDRERAIAGIKNAAWDVTYISELARKANEADYSEQRFLFATGDRKLASLAACIFVDAPDLDVLASILAAHLAPWWGKSASAAAKTIVDAIGLANSRPAPFQDRQDLGYVDDPIRTGEDLIRTLEREARRLN
jgi:hypothetical protein